MTCYPEQSGINGTGNLDNQSDVVVENFRGESVRGKNGQDYCNKGEGDGKLVSTVIRGQSERKLLLFYRREILE